MKDVILYLKHNGMCHNTLVVFSSDTGYEVNRGDNYPLRGYKNSSWKGGVRVPGFVTGGYLNEDRRGKALTDTIVHVTDWYPTLLAAAGLEIGHFKSEKLHNTLSPDIRFDDNGVGKIDIDGQNVWNAIQYSEVTDDISIDNREILLDLNDT